MPCPGPMCGIRRALAVRAAGDEGWAWRRAGRISGEGSSGCETERAEVLSGTSVRRIRATSGPNERRTMAQSGRRSHACRVGRVCAYPSNLKALGIFHRNVYSYGDCGLIARRAAQGEIRLFPVRSATRLLLRRERKSMALSPCRKSARRRRLRLKRMSCWSARLRLTRSPSSGVRHRGDLWFWASLIGRLG
jgi:hypothetical protein